MLFGGGMSHTILTVGETIGEIISLDKLEEATIDNTVIYEKQRQSRNT